MKSSLLKVGALGLSAGVLLAAALHFYPKPNPTRTIASLPCGASSKQATTKVDATMTNMGPLSKQGGSFSLLIGTNGNLEGIISHNMLGDTSVCINDLSHPMTLATDSKAWLINFSPDGKVDPLRGGAGTLNFRSQAGVPPVHVQIARNATNQFQIYVCRNGAACNETIQSINVTIHTTEFNGISYQGYVEGLSINGR